MHIILRGAQNSEVRPYLPTVTSPELRNAPVIRRATASAATAVGRICQPRQNALVSRRRSPFCAAASPQPEADTETVAIPSLSEAELIQVANSAEEAEKRLPAAPGIYAVYDGTRQLQYIGLSRKVSASVATHAQMVADLTYSVKCAALPSANRDLLTAAWKAWVQEAVKDSGMVPPGNAAGNTQWSAKRRAKPEVKLTPGKGAADLTVPITELISAVVKSNKVVAFVKGTRTVPQCGFSHKVLSMLNEARADYEVVDVLDEVHNPGLREAIKTFSQWPTIPQVYINGEFVGGADVLEEMHTKGELKAALA